MLNIYFGNHKDEIYNTEVYFNNTYKKEWIKTQRSIDMIRAIDNSTVTEDGEIRHKTFGLFKPTELSGGVKTLILMDHQPKKVFNASTCGNNCAKYLLLIAEDRDITVCLHHAMVFPKGFKVRVVNEKPYQIVTDAEELLFMADKYLRGEKE